MLALIYWKDGLVQIFMFMMPQMDAATSPEKHFRNIDERLSG